MTELLAEAQNIILKNKLDALEDLEARQRDQRADTLLKVFAENWTHIRHMEHYRMWGVNIYAIVVAAAASILPSGKAGPYHDWAAAFLLLFTFFNFLVAIKIEAVIENFVQANELVRSDLSIETDKAPVRTRESGLPKYVRFAWLFPVFYLASLAGMMAFLLRLH